MDIIIAILMSGVFVMFLHMFFDMWGMIHVLKDKVEVLENAIGKDEDVDENSQC